MDTSKVGNKRQRWFQNRYRPITCYSIAFFLRSGD